eukprot:GHVN01063672.1.p1 GENE.GHVN01063672.1~~GHVN01063672.1.p1  ORF type:complete len:172 (+),score=42.31 GHVN01063672.1:45-560(+)
MAEKANEEEKVKLTTKDNVSFEMSKGAACMSHLIANMIAETGLSEAIPLHNVDSNTLRKIIEWCEYHKDKPPPVVAKPLKSSVMTELVDAWDAEFIDPQPPNPPLAHEDVIALTLATNYMDIPGLLELSCAKIASLIRNKTPEQIRQELNIVNDFTPEEENQVREENRWCE